MAANWKQGNWKDVPFKENLLNEEGSVWPILDVYYKESLKDKICIQVIFLANEIANHEFIDDVSKVEMLGRLESVFGSCKKMHKALRANNAKFQIMREVLNAEIQEI